MNNLQFINLFTSKAQQTRTWSPEGLLIKLQRVDDNRFEPENKKAHINQNVQVQDLNTTRIVEFCLHWIKLHNYLSYVISPGGK